MKNNKVILKLMSQTDFDFNESQKDLILKILNKIKNFEKLLIKNNLDIDFNYFLFSLLDKEGLDSSKIEGTQTSFEDMYFDISEGINDRYSWETRNLVNLYISSFKGFKNGILNFDISTLTLLHMLFYNPEVKGYENNFNPEVLIKKIKPGQIVLDDKKPNWIGILELGIKNAQLIPIKPSKKIEYLKDMFLEVRKIENIGWKISTLKTIIKFHPFFEGIHPFSDGNGRIGRLLLVNLFSYSKLTTDLNWIFISDFWNKNRKEYIHQLNNVLTTNNWNDWIDFFLKSLFETINKIYFKVEKIIYLYDYYLKGMKTDGEKIVLKYFFKFPLLNKEKIIEKLNKKYKKPTTTIYRTLNNVSKKINVKETNKYYRFNKLFEIINS